MPLPALCVDTGATLLTASHADTVRRPTLAELYDTPTSSWDEIAPALHDELEQRMPDGDPSTLPFRFAHWYLASLADYQIMNGGFMQWIVNGFAVNGAETIVAFREIGAPLAAHLVEQVMTALPPAFRAACTHEDADRCHRVPLLPRHDRLFNAHTVTYGLWINSLSAERGIEVLLMHYARHHRIGVND